MLGLGLCVALVLLALGIFGRFSTQLPPPALPTPQVAPLAKATPDPPPPAAPQSRTVEVSPGTATDGHFVIRLLGGTSSR